MALSARSYWNAFRRRFRGRRLVLARRALATALLVAAAILAARPGSAPPTVAPTEAARASPQVPLTGGPGFATVPIHLADASVTELLARGMRVDVVTVDNGEQNRKVLASMATVVDIRSPPTDRGGLLSKDDKGPLVLISVPADIATQVAALSLRNPVAVTLR